MRNALWSEVGLFGASESVERRLEGQDFGEMA